MTSNTTNTTKHQMIFEAVKQRIKSGDFSHGDRIPTDTELVQEFQVSRPTVAKALRELERRGLVIRRPGSGTYVQKLEGTGKLFGLLIPGLGDTEIFDPICAEISRLSHAENHSLLWGASGFADLTEQDNLRDRVIQMCQQLVKNNVAGVFFSPFVVASEHDELNRLALTALEKAGITVILLDRDYLPYPARSKYDLVGIDNRSVGYMITDHLIECGCKKIIFVTHPYKISTIHSRVAGYHEALHTRGLPFESNNVFYGDPDNVDYVRGIIKETKPDGIVCGNDVVAGQLLHSLEDIGVNVPSDTLVAGIDDVKYASLLRVPLTTVRQPCQAMGHAAYKAMLDRIDNPKMPPRDIVLRCELVVRDSTGCATTN